LCGRESTAVSTATSGLPCSSTSSSSGGQKRSFSHSGQRCARLSRSISRQNSSKSIEPEPSSSTSSVSARITSSDGVKPSWRNISPSSLWSTSPPPSRSNILKVFDHVWRSLAGTMLV